MNRVARPVLIFGLVVSIALAAGCTDSNLKKAQSLREAQDYAQAIHYYKLAIEKNPDNKMARYGLIEAYSQQLSSMPHENLTLDVAEKAIAELRPAAEPLMDDPTIKRYMSLIYQVVGKKYAEVGMDEKAAEAWAEVAKIEPTFPEAEFNLGVALIKLEKPEEAIEHFEKALELNPYFLKAYQGKGNALLALNRNDEAVKEYQKALELNPDDPPTRHNLGVAYSRIGETDKAISEWKQGIEIDPSYPLPYVSLNRLYTEQGEKKKAEEIIDRWKTFVETHKKPAEAQEAAPGA
jgi:tetratricopeptide (TPR) repeat protein